VLTAISSDAAPRRRSERPRARDRRISLVDRQGQTWPETGALVRRRSSEGETDTYTHVLIDGRELDYAALLEPAEANDQVARRPPRRRSIASTL
jgi:hypothetical protein